MVPTALSRRANYLVIIVVAIIVLLIFTWNGNPGYGTTPFEVELSTFEPLSFKKTSYKTKLFDLNLRYVLSPTPCPPEVTLAVIVVTSHFNNIETRSAMRRAFSQSDLANLGLRRLFLLGQAPNSVYVTQASLLHENKRFGDIIQGNFKEAYRNLTYKHVMGLKWVSENCHSVKYVVKMDDDIVINVNRVVNLLRNITLPANSIAGYVMRGLNPIREPANKWFVTSEEYRFSKYPSFVSGWFYVTTPKIATKLVLMSHYFKYFWIDDVFVTGVLAKNIEIKQLNLKQYFTVYPEFLQCCITGVRKHLDCDILIGPNGGNSNLFFEFNEAMKICEMEHCDKRFKPINETCVAERKVSLRGGNGFIENYNLH